MPPHILNLYQKPAQGTAFLKRLTAYNYRHKIAAVGGFDTASCDVLVTRGEAERWLEQYLGNRVAFYVDNPMEPIWEGLVNRITYQIGNVVFTASLDKLFNRIQITYQTGTPPATTNAAVNNTNSQAVYGIKQGTIDAHLQYTGSGSTLPDNLRDHLIAIHAWPKASASFNSQSSPVLLSVECVGFFHVLEWENSPGTSAAASASASVIALFQATANSNTFFDDTTTALVATNTAFNQNRLNRSGQTLWQALQAIQETGDGAGTPWVMGITPTDPNLDTRRFYYRAANTSIAYVARLSDGMRIRNRYGGLVRPWTVQPDRSILLSDVLTGWGGLGDDPRESYIELVEYDAESQSVAWQSTDNMELEGAMQLVRRFKTHGSRFGEPPRNTE